MTALVNGQKVTAEPAPDPVAHVAEAAFATMAEEGETWAGLTDEERQFEHEIATHYVAAHIAFLHAQGFRIVPPGATPVPTSQEEAMGMVRAAKAFFDAQKRRGKLMAQSSPVLILPKGSKH